MDIEIRSTDGVIILNLSGNVTVGESSIELRNKVRELVKSGQKNILLNMGNVHYMNSSGIGELVGAYTSVTKQGGQFKLLNLTENVHELLVVTKLLTIFETFQNEREALQSFQR